MKKPLLLFAIKCCVIIYFAACTSIDKLAVSESITPLVTKGTWKVNCFSNINTDNTCDFKDYTFTFNTAGGVTAVKNGVIFTGHWIEDNISKKITIHFKNSNAVLNGLNKYWDITSITNDGISFKKTSERNTEKFYITAL